MAVTVGMFTAFVANAQVEPIVYGVEPVGIEEEIVEEIIITEEVTEEVIQITSSFPTP